MKKKPHIEVVNENEYCGCASSCTSGTMGDLCKHDNGCWITVTTFWVFKKRLFFCYDCEDVLQGKRLKAWENQPDFWKRDLKPKTKKRKVKK